MSYNESTRAVERLEAERQRRMVTELIDEHRRELGIRRKQLISVGPYGIRDDGKWHLEMRKFVREVVGPRLPKLLLSEDALFKSIECRIDRDEVVESKCGGVPFSADMDPLAYERLCADLLTARGWAARTTSASGDQGADVLASRNGVSVVLQCKRYSRPVGNKAVQAAHAARGFNACQVAVVVSNAGFTKSAMQLASTLGVKLMHHDQLIDL